LSFTVIEKQQICNESVYAASAERSDNDIYAVDIDHDLYCDVDDHNPDHEPNCNADHNPTANSDVLIMNLIMMLIKIPIMLMILTELVIIINYYFIIIVCIHALCSFVPVYKGMYVLFM